VKALCLRPRDTHTYIHKHRHAMYARAHTHRYSDKCTYLQGQILSKGPGSRIKTRTAPHLLYPLPDTDGIGSKTKGGFNAGEILVCVLYVCGVVRVCVCMSKG
jgi:hypothetical protein